MIAEHRSANNHAQTEVHAWLQILVNVHRLGLVMIATCLSATKVSLSRLKACLNGWMILLDQTFGFNIILAITNHGARELLG